MTGFFMTFTYTLAIKKLQQDSCISLVDINRLNYHDRHLFLKEISRWSTFGMGQLANLKLESSSFAEDSNFLNRF
jgi:hypothetical protein